MRPWLDRTAALFCCVASSTLVAVNLAVLNTSETLSHLIRLIGEAQKGIVLVSPYIDLGGDDAVGRAIRDALSRGVKVALVFRNDEKTPTRIATLTKIMALSERGLSFRAVPNLHAKFYVSERAALVSSLNLVRSSVLNSIEMGLWSEAPEFIERIRAFLKSEIWSHDTKEIVADAPDHWEDDDTASGACIYCAEPMEINYGEPTCERHRMQRGGGRYCHCCAERFDSTPERTLCRECYRQLKLT